MMPRKIALAGLVAGLGMWLLAWSAPRAESQSSSGAMLEERWPVPQLGSHEEFDPESLSYLADGPLLVADSDAESIWSIDRYDGRIRPWLVQPAFGMVPSRLRVEPTSNRIFVSSHAGLSEPSETLPGFLLLLADDGSLLSRWRAAEGDGNWVSRSAGSQLAVSPLQRLAWLVHSPIDPQRPQHSRLSTLSLDGERWSGGRCSRTYEALGIDGLGRYYLAFPRPATRDEGPAYQVDRVEDRGCRAPEPFVVYDGSLPYRQDLAIASWPASDRVVLANGVLISAYDLAGARQFSTFAPRLCLTCSRIAEVATRRDGGFAVLTRNQTGAGLAGSTGTQVIQFDRHGYPVLRSVFRSATMPSSWEAARLSVDGEGRARILHPDLDLVAGLDHDGRLQEVHSVASWARDIDATGSYLAVKGSSGRVGAVQLLDATGAQRWYQTCDCDESSGIAVFDSRVVVANAAAAHLEAFSITDGSSAVVSSGRDPARLWSMDLAASRAELFTIERTASRLEVYEAGDEGGTPRRFIQIPADAFRIDATPEGRLALLTRSRGLLVMEPNGVVLTHFSVPEVAGDELVQPVDVAWATSGELLVLDASHPSVLRIRLDRPVAPPPAPTSRPVEDAGDCVVEGDKVAAPDRVQLGEEVTISLRLKIACPDTAPKLDVMLVLPSSNLSGGNGRESHDYQSIMLQAAERMLGAVDLERDRIAVLALHYGLRIGFSQDPDAIRDEIRRVGPYYPPHLPDDARAYELIDPSLEYLDAQARPDAERVLVIIANHLSVRSGWPDYSARARAAGIRTVIVYRPWDGSLPDDALAYLERFVETPSDLINLDDVLASDALLDRLATQSGAPGISDVEIRDEMGSAVELVPGSSVPPADEQGSTATWRSAGLPSGGITVSLGVRPQRTGHLPTNRIAEAFFTDPSGIRRRYEFPIPYIDVLPSPTASDPAPSITPTASPSAVPVATTTPEPLWLPLLLREACQPDHRRADVVLVIDASTSMLELTGANRSKLEAAREAASRLVDELDLSLGDQVGLVAFNEDVVLTLPLSSDSTAIAQAIASIEASPGTCIPCAMESATELLFGTRLRETNTPALVMLTDGQSNVRPVHEAVTLADAAKQAGAEIFTVGLGEDVEVQSLQAMASRPEFFYRTLDAEALGEIFANLVIEIPCPANGFWGQR